MQSPLQSPSNAGSPISSAYQESRKSSQTSTSGLSGKILFIILFVYTDFILLDLRECHKLF